MATVENLNVELKKLSEICMRLKPWVEAGLLDYRRMESEYSQLIARNEQQKLENIQAEEQIKKAIQTADAILAQAKAEEQKTVANIQTLWARAQAKFKEAEKRIDEADKKAIKEMIRTIQKEEVAA